MQQNMPNAQLIIYPTPITARTTSTPKLFVEHATLFLNGVTTTAKSSEPEAAPVEVVVVETECG